MILRDFVETQSAQKVLVTALIENDNDVRAADAGRISAESIRRIEINDAQVEREAKYVAMPKRLIDQLGPKRIKTVEAKTVSGPIRFGIYEQVKLTIQGRDCEVRVSEVADNCPVLIGYIPLELLDFVVSPKEQKLIGNPDHGGQYMIDMY
jgi:predicted aspartyl protease